MGTNYYLRLKVCPHCAKPEKTIHIGKSSVGWCFGLHVIPEDGIHDLDDFRKLWSDDTAQIFDEYDVQTETPADATFPDVDCFFRLCAMRADFQFQIIVSSHFSFRS